MCKPSTPGKRTTEDDVARPAARRGSCQHGKRHAARRRISSGRVAGPPRPDRRAALGVAPARPHFVVNQLVGPCHLLGSCPVDNAVPVLSKAQRPPRDHRQRHIGENALSRSKPSQPARSPMKVLFIHSAISFSAVGDPRDALLFTPNQMLHLARLLDHDVRLLFPVNERTLCVHTKPGTEALLRPTTKHRPALVRSPSASRDQP